MQRMSDIHNPINEAILIISSLELIRRNVKTYIGAQGIAAAKLHVSKNVFDRIKDLTRLGRC